jgi:dienelactone hydrolase
MRWDPQLGLLIALALAAAAATTLVLGGGARAQRAPETAAGRIDPEAIVQLPPLELVTPAANVPAAFKPFHGAWGGIWDNGMAHVLVVEDVQPDGTAAIVYAWGDLAASNSLAGWERMAGVVNERGIAFMRRNHVVTYTWETLAAGARPQLSGIYRIGERVIKGTFSRLGSDTPLGGRSKAAVVVDHGMSAGRIVAIPHLNAVEPEGLRRITLSGRLYMPKRAADSPPVPLAVVNHGSAGGYELLADYASWAEAEWLLARGYAVLVPMRRGRGGSGGAYTEAVYERDRSGRVTGFATSLNDAIADLASAIAYGRGLPGIAKGPVLLAGTSRGGFLSVAYAGRRPDDVLGVVSFAGGWMGGIPDLEPLNPPAFAAAGQGSLQSSGARVPQLWIHGDGDEVFREAHVRQNHAAFEAAGGRADLLMIKATPAIGHNVRAYPDRWQPAADGFLKRLGR